MLPTKLNRRSFSIMHYLNFRMVQVNTSQIAKEMCFNNTGVHMNICMNPGTNFYCAKN